MEKISVVNYHITNNCNYNCIYCFGKFNSKEKLTIDEQKKIIDSIDQYFKNNHIVNGRINFAGGEPLLSRDLNELIEYTCSKGIKVSIITNGSLLTDEIIKLWSNKLSYIGLSINSLNVSTNQKLQCCCKGKTLSLNRIVQIGKLCNIYNIELKINTVVCKENYQEDLNDLYRLLKPSRIKFLQMTIVEEVNSNALELKISKNEFNEFCKRHKNCIPIPIIEDEDSMQNSYILIDPDGYLMINNQGKYEKIGNLLTESIDYLIKEMSIDYPKYNNRYCK